MEFIKQSNDVVLVNPDSFDLEQTFECGQCFRFNKIGEKDYVTVAFGKALRIMEKDGCIIFKDTSEDDFINIWAGYFDLNRDYSKIKDSLSKNDVILKEAVEYAPGIRVLNQEFFECLISFIISQNNRIPMIKKVINNISIKYGNYIATINDEDYYSFPSATILADITEDELMLCKTGFRAKYIVDAVNRYLSDELNFNKFCSMTTEDVRKKLMNIKGVGPKVSDCVLLFSCMRSEVFPTDVWIKRVMSYFYFENNETAIKDIHNLAQEKYGEFAGFAQQFLFNYARQLKIGA